MKWKAIWGNLVVLPDSIEETDEVLKNAKSFGFELPETQEKERLQHSQIEGTLIDFGGNAFEDWKGNIPERGKKVVFDKYAGFIKKIDGKDYRIIRDTDLFLMEA